MNTRIKDVVNYINIVLAALAIVIAVFGFIDGKIYQAFFYIIMATILIVSALIYNWGKNLVQKVAKIVSVFQYIEEKVSISSDSELGHKIINLFFLLDLESLKKNKEAFSQTDWFLKHGTPFSPAISTLFTEYSAEKPPDKVYILTEDEKNIINEHIIKNFSLSNLQIIQIVYENFPKLKDLEKTNDLISLKLSALI